MPPPKLTADQLRRIEEIEEFQRAADHLKHLVTELEGNRAGQTRTIQQLSEKIANAASQMRDRKSTRLNSSHLVISYAVFCLKKKKNILQSQYPDQKHRDEHTLQHTQPSHGRYHLHQHRTTIYDAVRVCRESSQRSASRPRLG